MINGAVQDTCMSVKPGVNPTFVGGPGGPRGVALLLSDAGPGPTELNACTLTVYEVPLVRPVIV